LKVLLVVPPYRTWLKKPLGEFDFSTIPLGLTYIAAVLKLKGIATSILDLSFPNVGMERLEKKLAHDKPDVVGITSMTGNYRGALSVAKSSKRWNPEVTVALGGIHATFMWKEILATVPEVDMIVRYEGEMVMSEFIDALLKKHPLRDVQSICFREEGKPISTPLRGRIEDLDKLPYPAHDLLEPSAEEYVRLYGARNFPVITTRGCPFGCVYCSTMAFHGQKYRFRSTSNIIGELEYLIEKFRADNISFVDDNFTMHKERVLTLCKEIMGRGLEIEWGCSARVDQVSEGLLKTMKEAGCKDIFFGIESASQHVLDIVKKSFSVKQAKAAVKAAERLGIKTHCSFILGLPGETSRSLNRHVQFIDETKPSGRVLPNKLQILPGTELYDKKREYFAGRPNVSDADIVRTQLEMLAGFYRINFGVNELFPVRPPNLIIE